MRRRHVSGAIYPLVFVEGDTETLFYNRIKHQFFPSVRYKHINLGGNFNINQKVLAHASDHLRAHQSVEFAVFICIDRESRSDKAPIDMDMIGKELRDYRNIDQNNIRLFEAVQDIESWFFHDISGIYSFLKAPHSRRNCKKYIPVEKFNHSSLSKLFTQHGREYKKGVASESFIDNLDIILIRSKAIVLDTYCTTMENI